MVGLFRACGVVEEADAVMTEAESLLKARLDDEDYPRLVELLANTRHHAEEEWIALKGAQHVYLNSLTTA